jgi:hypothetical protein
MKKTALALLLFASCNRTDPAKEKELVELRDKVAKLQAPPAMAAVKEAAPPVVRPQEPPAEAVESPTEGQKIAAKVKHAATDLKAFAELLLESDSPESKRLSYALLKKNPDRFAGTPWRVTGRIVEIQETNGTTICRLALDYYQQNIVFVVAFGETDFVEGDTVDVLGIISGAYTYRSQAGWNITIPSLVGTRLLKRGDLAKGLKLLTVADKKPAQKKTSEQEVEELTK